MEDRWSVDALKEYVDSNFGHVRSEIEARYIEKNREHDKFEASVRESMVKQNEFRGALSDLGKTMATRLEVDALDEKVTTRQGRTEAIQGKIVGALILLSVILMPAVVIVTYLLSK